MIAWRDWEAHYECWERYSRHILQASIEAQAVELLDDAIRLAKRAVIPVSDDHSPDWNFRDVLDYSQPLSAAKIIGMSPGNTKFEWRGIRPHQAINTVA
ncbi:hypothetical protein BDV12DRAFT_164333 [Aspergillus spectabilis]